MDDRQACIDAILQDLHRLETSDAHVNRDAVAANIEFFQAARTLRSYLAWLLLRARRLPHTSLLELTDFGFPRWEHAMHSKLIEVERRPFPGLVSPLVERLVQFVSAERKPVILVELGCGGAEVERQVLQRLLANGHQRRVVFVGIERSFAVQQLAMDNLAPLRAQVDLVHMETIDRKALEELMQKRTATFLVVLCRNDIFNLGTAFPERTFDLAFHSLFAHHLSMSEQERVMQMTRKVARRGIEYDSLKSWGLMLPQSLTGWRSPAFLNAAIFSNLRCCRKRAVRRRVAGGGAQLSFHVPPGTYLLESAVSQTGTQQQQ